MKRRNRKYIPAYFRKSIGLQIKQRAAACQKAKNKDRREGPKQKPREGGKNAIE